MTKATNRRRMVNLGIEEDSFEFVADFEKNFPQRKQFRLFQTSKSRRRRRRPDDYSEQSTSSSGLLYGVEDPSVSTPSPAAQYYDPPTKSCLPFSGILSSTRQKQPAKSSRSETSTSTTKSIDPYFPMQEPTTEPIFEEKVSPNSEPRTIESLPTPPMQRAPDPHDIDAELLRELQLLDFPETARQRAVAKVSGWLFDHDLIDELLMSTKKATNINSAVPSSSRSVGSASVPSQEGFEVSMVSGLTATFESSDTPKRLDSYLSKFKLMTQQQLKTYNSQLTDGDMTVSGADVQNLVRELHHHPGKGRLRELSTYVFTNTGVSVDTKALKGYPRLQNVNNARRNIKQCFQEFEYYSDIPITCYQLREGLHNCGDYDPMTLQAIAQDHIDHLVCLIDIEAGLKQRLDESTVEEFRRRRQRGKPEDDVMLQKRLHQNRLQIRNFLYDRTRLVSEVGDEIRTRVLAGICNAFDDAIHNSTEGLQAFVEITESYETIHQRTAPGTPPGRSPAFVTMRAAVSKKLYQYCEKRCLQVFREVYQEAKIREEQRRREADDEESSIDTSANAQMTAILAACNYLTSEISVVRRNISPLFPPSWSWDTFWSTIVAKICTQKIINLMGGQHGNELPEMTVTQLLDLVAWVEHCQDILNDTTPDNAAVPRNSLFNANAQGEMAMGSDSLRWANNMLWKVHDLAKDEFLYRTKEQTDEWLDNVYINDHVRSESEDGRLMTSLCEDVYSLAGVQLETIRERLSRDSEALVQAVGVILKNLYEKQIACRNTFLNDFETCCAASNDFFRMVDRCEEILDELIEECDLSPTDTEVLNEQCAVLTGLYSSDAVFAAQKVHLYIFEDIERAIASKLFKEEWVEATHNQFALTLVRTVEDFLGDLQIYLDKVMVGKSLDAIVRATVIFYVKCIVRRSTRFRAAANTGIWTYNHRALDRMRGDISVMRQYFESLTSNYPTIRRTIENEFQILDTIHELFMIAAGLSRSTERDFIILLQKHVKDSTITKYVVGDLWHLVQPTREKDLYELMDSMEEELLQVAPNDREATLSILARQTVPGLRLDMELAKLLDESQKKRRRPGIKKSTTDNGGDKTLEKWNKAWEKQLRRLENGEGFAIPEFPTGKAIAKKSVKLVTKRGSLLAQNSVQFAKEAALSLQSSFRPDAMY